MSTSAAVSSPGRSTPLGEFLRARRRVAELTPELANRRNRQASGLRREEVAVLASVSSNYYTRLEQGRERNPSPAVLAGLSSALKLDEPSHAHLLDLADATRRNGGPPDTERHSFLPAELARPLISALRCPAIVLNRWGDIIASNDLGRALYGPVWTQGNLVRSTFLNESRRHFYPDWEQSAHCTAGMLRTAYGQDPRSVRFRELFEELSTASSEFRDIWREYPVTRKTGGTKLLEHDLAGSLRLTYQVFQPPQDPGVQVIVYQPVEPGADSYARLLDIAAPEAGAAC
jgi:transcriptional regulator with XRE-family HTH domain